MSKTVKATSILFFSFLMSLFLFGCSPNLSRFGFAADNRINPLTAEQLIQLAQKSAPPQSTVCQLKAAELYIQAGAIAEAKQALKIAQNEDYTLSSDLKQTLLESRLALLKQDNGHARALIISVLAKLDTSILNQMSQDNFAGNASTQKIALLLPSKGQYAQAAKTIRDGFLAAYYKSKSNQASQTHLTNQLNPPSASISGKTSLTHSSHETTVQVYDTSEGGKIMEAYQRALADNATVIVGPLIKSEVDAIANIPSNIPILALNTLADGRSIPKHLHQFGLLPEDEIVAVVHLAKKQGHHRSLLLVPEGEWGKRMMNAFYQQWQNVGGQIVDVVILKNNRELSNQIQAALKAKNNRRRQDIDMIFMAASPELARQIKPLLTYHGAENLPVYASASVFSGTQSVAEDQDLNGVLFCDMPAVFNSADNQDKIWAKTAASSPRYFALGMDAYHLALQLGSQQPLYYPTGATGKLYFNQRQHRIQRDLVCARFKEGVPVAIAE